MKCHPLRWLWGILPLAIFSWLAVMSIREPLERDLSQRAGEALRNAGLGWAKVRFDGRDGTVSGQAAEDNEPAKALEVARNTWGVRAINSQVELLRKVENYVWSAAHTDGKLVLTGFVPNDTARKAIIASVKSNFPKATLEDKLELARGNPPVEGWLGGIGFGLKQLAGLKRGVAELSGMNLTLVGEASTVGTFKDVKTALAKALPKTITLAADRVTAPVVANYVWLAKLAGNQVSITGFVPSDEMRAQIVAHAKKVFGKTPVADKMELGEGAPAGFDKAVIVGIDQLATLQEGAAELKSAQLTLSGTAADEAIADATRKAFTSQVPGTIKTVEVIKWAKPTLATIAPYVTKIDAGASSVDVSGYVPTEAARASLMSEVKSRFSKKTVNDKLQLGAGDPAGHDVCLAAGIGGLARLGTGTLVLSDKQLSLAGKTEDEALAIAIPGEVRANAKATCETKVVVAYDDSKKRKAAEDLTNQAQRDAQGAADLEAKRQADLLAAEAKRLADASNAAAAEAKRAVELAAAEQAKKREQAAACQSDLRNAASRGLIQFERASDVIDRASRPTLKALGEIAKQCPNVLIEIEGHTDSEGTPERNKSLAERRAQSVVSVLVDAGVSADRIKAVGYGDSKPIAPNDTAENRAKNRRIEFSVVSQ
jgi:OmpA-OmpF porin, OOP family